MYDSIEDGFKVTDEVLTSDRYAEYSEKQKIYLDYLAKAMNKRLLTALSEFTSEKKPSVLAHIEKAAGITAA